MLVLFSEKDTGFPSPLPQVISHGYGWLLNRSQLGALFQGVRNCIQSPCMPESCASLPFLSGTRISFQALNFILLTYRSLIQSYFCICSILVACISVILILQVLCWCPDMCIGQQLQHWQGLELRPTSVGKARPPMLSQHLKLCPALRSSKMHFILGLKSKEEAEVQLGSGLRPSGLSSRLACEKANAQCWSSGAFPLLGSDWSPPLEGLQIK